MNRSASGRQKNVNVVSAPRFRALRDERLAEDRVSLAASESHMTTNVVNQSQQALAFRNLKPFQRLAEEYRDAAEAQRSLQREPSIAKTAHTSSLQQH